MHLKTLSLRGFKSFASATEFEFEPGITCVVGPNGSGKSNVVDALAWVMGEQGAKQLRGGKMEDVIFAGTPGTRGKPGRAALGRAEVSLTIDNSDGALPIEFGEVTITRTLFRTGTSEYAINGSPCRLLDVQELLSDTGIGRQMHVVVGQGQLDAVLRATPAERRGFIEEAAGVLKHRKRKERALRKLDATAGNLQRLADLCTELRRQLGPLGRQADAARRAGAVQAEARDARARLLADDVAQLAARMRADAVDEAQFAREIAQAEQQLASQQQALARQEVAAAQAVAAVGSSGATFHELVAARERLRGLAALAAERVRLLGLSIVEPDPADPVELGERAAQAEAKVRELDNQVTRAQSQLDQAELAQAAAEQLAQRAERDLAQANASAADRREALASLTGAVAAKRSRVEAHQTEIERLRLALTEVGEREQAARLEFAALETKVVGAEASEVGLDAAHERAVLRREEAERALAEVEAQSAEAERRRATWLAKIEALRLALDRKDGGGALLAAGLPGLAGSLAEVVAVQPGYEAAIAAVLGPLAESIVVTDLDAALRALGYLREEGAGQAVLVVQSEVDVETPSEPQAPGPSDANGTVAAATVVAGRLPPAVREALDQVLVVGDLAAAAALVSLHPEQRAVTLAGDLITADLVDGGSVSAPSSLHLSAALEQAQDEEQLAIAAMERARFARQAARTRLAEAQAEFELTLSQLDESDAALAAIAERLGTLGAAIRAATAEAQRLQGTLDAALAARQTQEAALATAVAELAAGPAQPTASPQVVAAAGAARAEAESAAQVARTLATDALLALRAAQEEHRQAANRAQALRRAAAAEVQAREEADRRAEVRARNAQVATEVGRNASTALAALEESLARAEAEHARAEARHRHLAQEVVALRAEGERLSEAVRDLGDHALRDAVLRSQRQAKFDQLNEQAVTEFGLRAAQLVAEYGPQQPVPTGSEPTGKAFDRAEQEQRLAKAERALARIGVINPLALEEYTALEERHQYLLDQQEDLTRTRAELLGIVAEIDHRTQQVFTQAFADTATQFAQVFARLFPGGRGALVLSDPSDALTTGVELEARPAGKNVKHLSLLSGGERSLTALAFLVALFQARPSPFLILDEVEAALDNVNLSRVLEVFADLSTKSQLVVITHQKRTMEIADALYGVAMRDDGVTTVISQRTPRASAA